MSIIEKAANKLGHGDAASQPQGAAEKLTTEKHASRIEAAMQREHAQTASATAPAKPASVRPDVQPQPSALMSVKTRAIVPSTAELTMPMATFRSLGSVVSTAAAGARVWGIQRGV